MSRAPVIRVDPKIRDHLGNVVHTLEPDTTWIAEPARPYAHGEYEEEQLAAYVSAYWRQHGEPPPRRSLSQWRDEFALFKVKKP